MKVSLYPYKHSHVHRARLSRRIKKSQVGKLLAYRQWVDLSGMLFLDLFQLLVMGLCQCCNLVLIQLGKVCTNGNGIFVSIKITDLHTYKLYQASTFCVRYVTLCCECLHTTNVKLMKSPVWLCLTLTVILLPACLSMQLYFFCSKYIFQ